MVDPSFVPHKVASGVSPAPLGRTQRAPGRRLAALPSAHLAELSRMMSKGFETIDGKFALRMQELSRAGSLLRRRSAGQTIDSNSSVMTS